MSKGVRQTRIRLHEVDEHAFSIKFEGITRKEIAEALEYDGWTALNIRGGLPKTVFVKGEDNIAYVLNKTVLVVTG